MSVEVAETVSSESWFHILMILWLKKWLLCLLVEHCMESFKECPLVPECKGCAKRPGRVFLERIFLVKIMSPLFCQYVSVGSFKRRSLTSYGNLFMLVTILVARSWTSSSNFLSFLKKGAANDIPTSRRGHTSALYNFIRTLGCQLEMVLFMIPRVLFAEDETDSAWLLNFNW